MHKKITVTRETDERGLRLESELLRDARLGPNVRVIVQDGEIRLLPEEEGANWLDTLEELAGCLGEEPVEEYDFDLKLTHPYEA